MNLRRWWLCCGALWLAGVTVWAEPVDVIAISSPAFAKGKPIPARYAMAEQNISPELHFKAIPAKAKTLALFVDDPDSPTGLWTHWLVWNLSVDTTSVPAGQLPGQAREGRNSFHHVRYDGPAPPAGTGIHRYFFRVYALDAVLDLGAGSDRASLLSAMNGHVVGTGETFGTYQYGPALSP